MTAIKKLALAEPLVDTVGHDCLNTKPARLLTLDIQTCTKEDLMVDAPFELVVTRNDHIHALVLWFDVWFDCSHKPVRSPNHPPGDDGAINLGQAQCRIWWGADFDDHVTANQVNTLEADCFLSGGFSHSMQGRSDYRTLEVYTKFK